MGKGEYRTYRSAPCDKCGGTTYLCKSGKCLACLNTSRGEYGSGVVRCVRDSE